MSISEAVSDGPKWMSSKHWAQARAKTKSASVNQKKKNSLGSLSSNYFAEPIDLMFVFEINALMPCSQRRFAACLNA